MPSSSSGNPRDDLRQTLRASRRALTPVQHYALSLEATANLVAHPWYRRARRIALYWPIGSEADTRPLLATAFHDNKQIALPAILFRHGRLIFVRFRETTVLRDAHHGIPQPRPGSNADRLNSRMLDLVLVPLLGFDDRGNRLGSGAGYYDRSFNFRNIQALERPRLVGFAFDCQRARNLKREDWDVPLDAVVTESGWHYPKA